VQLRPLLGIDFDADGTSIVICSDAGDVRVMSVSDTVSEVIISMPDASPPPVWDVRTAALEMVVECHGGRNDVGERMHTLTSFACGDGFAGLVPLLKRAEYRGLLRGSLPEKATPLLKALGFKVGKAASASEATALGLDRSDPGLFVHVLTPRTPPLSALVAASLGEAAGAAYHLPQQASLRTRLALPLRPARGEDEEEAGPRPKVGVLWAVVAGGDGFLRVRLVDPSAEFLRRTDRGVWRDRAKATASAAIALRGADDTELKRKATSGKPGVAVKAMGARNLKPTVARTSKQARAAATGTPKSAGTSAKGKRKRPSSSDEEEEDDSEEEEEDEEEEDESEEDSDETPSQSDSSESD
jgi:hypothetical protein